MRADDGRDGFKRKTACANEQRRHAIAAADKRQASLRRRRAGSAARRAAAASRSPTRNSWTSRKGADGGDHERHRVGADQRKGLLVETWRHAADELARHVSSRAIEHGGLGAVVVALDGADALRLGNVRRFMPSLCPDKRTSHNLYTPISNLYSQSPAPLNASRPRK